MKKKGTSGAAKNYITRTQAVRKLQISLADFRRLCILKGIFPRQPRNTKKANKGSTAPTTFYYAKDIAFLQHEPVLQALREHKTFAKKLSRAVGRREWEMAKGLHDNKPVYRLDHIIKQRYPTFDDSLRDLDDALSLVMLFANLPASGSAVGAETVQACARLCAQWQLYVMQARALRKVFLSIKGIYFQAEIRGQSITWLVPYMFTQHVPHDTDFRIMATFLELYRTLLGFVLYKLYTDLNLVFPPPIDEVRDEGGAGVGAFRLTEAAKAALEGRGAQGHEIAEQGKEKAAGAKPAKKVSARDVRREIQAIGGADGTANGADEDDADNTAAATSATAAATEPDTFVERPSKNDGDDATSGRLVTLADLDATATNSPQQTLFAPYYIYISRECPRGVLEFVLRSFGASGAQIGWDEVAGSGSALHENDERITHHIIDRPAVPRRHPGKRVYVQPQWVVDCANAKRVLSPGSYAPGQTLPPHLSPFVDDAEVRRRGGYVPAEAGASAQTGDETAASADIGVAADDADESDADDSEADAAVFEDEVATRPALAALLADPLNEDLLSPAELEAESQGGEEALQALQSAYDAAKRKMNARSSSGAGGKKAASKAEAAAADEDEAKRLAKMLMSNRQRKLYNKMSLNEGKRGDEKRRLEDKKQRLVKVQQKKKKAGGAAA